MSELELVHFNNLFPLIFVNYDFFFSTNECERDQTHAAVSSVESDIAVSSIQIGKKHSRRKLFESEFSSPELYDQQNLSSAVEMSVELSQFIFHSNVLFIYLYIFFQRAEKRFFTCPSEREIQS